MLLSFACNTTKYLQNEELLYESTEVRIKSSSPQNKIKNKGDLAYDLKQLAVPKPNKRFLGQFPVRLWAYNYSLGATKGLKKWMNESYGESPVLFEDEQIDLTKERMKNFLFQNGYFTSEIEHTKDVYNKKISIDYSVTLNSQYKFGKITHPNKNNGIYKVINFYKAKSVLKEGVPFSTDLLDTERERITNDAKNSGYFRFSKELIKFDLDSANTKNKVEVTLKLKELNNNALLKKSYIKTIQLYSDYNPNSDATFLDKDIGCEFQLPDTTILKYKKLAKNKHYVFKDDIINYSVLRKTIQFKPSLPYSAKDYNSTINNLINLGIYKFVDIQLNPCQRDNYDSLNVMILLTTRDKIEFEADAEVNSKTDSSNPNSGISNLGTALSLSHSNLNTFGGAERFKTSIFGGIELQPLAPDSLSLINAFELSIQANLLIPRFIVPFELGANLSRVSPKTSLGLGAQYINRKLYFNETQVSGIDTIQVLRRDTIESINFNTSFGYQWQAKQTTQHRFNLLDVNYFRLLSQDFIETLPPNSLLRNSFTNQLLIGTQYTFVYNSLFDTNQGEYTYLKTQVEVVGNFINSFLQPKEVEEDSVKRKKLFGVRTAQLVKFDVEGKYYRIFSKKHLLANRINFGIGIPYGNSTALPYNKQYFVGGANSLRAFRIRALGPGSFVRNDIVENDSIVRFPDQTGELKIELNTEYRFDIAKFLEAAFFIDAGNIWNLNLNRPEDNTKTNFQFKDLFNEIAIGAGAGIRLDFSYFIIRADVGIPLRRIWKDGSSFQWINADRFSGLPSRERYALNLAIGYPF